MNVKFKLSRKLRRVWSENEICELVVECNSLEQAQDWLLKELLDDDQDLETDVLEGRWEELDKDCCACEVVEGPTIESVEVVGDDWEFPDVILGDE